MRTIGILGGLSPESTTAYYERITRRYHAIRGDFGYPEILIHSLNFKEFIEADYVLPERVLGAIEGLHRAGADFVVAACNSIHVVYDELRDRLPIPWLSIMSACCEAIRRQGLKKVGLLGTVFTIRNGFYQRFCAGEGVEVIVPGEAACEMINDIIYRELVTAQVAEPSRAKALEVIEALRARGAGGVILGCTELPFLIRPQDTDLPVFDTAGIHADKALEVAMDTPIPAP